MLRFLRRFNVQNTLMFCCNFTSPCKRKGDPACLPSFLTFQPYSVPPIFDTTTRNTTKGYFMK
jgi:hypothetical protein